MSVAEDFSGIDVDDMLQLRKKKQLLFFDMLLHSVPSGLAIGICS